jgi:hypothetical protein
MAGMTATPYEAYPVGLDFAEGYGQRLDTVVELTGGLMFTSGVEACWLRERFPRTDVVLHGAFAELSKIESMHTYFVNEATDRASRGELADVLLRRLDRTLSRGFACVRPDLRASLRERASESLRRRIAALDPGLSTESALQVVYLEEFLGKITRAGSLIWNDRVRTRHPFAWPAYFDLVLQTRAEDRRGPGAQLHLLERLSPELLAYPDSNTGLRIGAPAPLVRATQFTDKVRRVLSIGRAAHDHSDPGYWIAHMKPAARQLLSEAAGGGVLDRVRCMALAESLERPARALTPMGAVRGAMARYEAAATLQKALTFRAFVAQTGVTER